MIICTILLLIVVAAAAYYMGLQRQKSAIEVLNNEKAILQNEITQNIKTASSVQNRTLNDYDSACLEYQKLYAAYDTLYQKTGTNSGAIAYTSPDAARGNEQSCYR